MDKFFFNEAVKELFSIQDIIRWSVSHFSTVNIWYGHGSDNPWDEAERLVLPSLWLPLNISDNMRNARLTSSEKKRIIKRAILRVNKRIPVAYLTKKAWFCGYDFYVDERVQIPRSPISELIHNRFTGLIQKQPKYILDMCTGSGCIAIACAYVFPKVKVDAVDVSPDALAVTEYNIEDHCLMNRVTPILSDLFLNLPILKYDLIISNPPYVSAEEMLNLPKEYFYEPKLSLVSGSDGLEAIRRILACASDYLTNSGILICEVGNNMTSLIKQYPLVPFTWLKLHNGGEGIFMLTKSQLLNSRKYFIMYRN